MFPRPYARASGAVELLKRFPFDHSLAFFDNNQVVGGHFRHGLFVTVRPADVEVGGGGGPKTEVEAQVACGIKTGLTEDFLSLDLSAVVSGDAGTNRAAVGLHPDQFH